MQCFSSVQNFNEMKTIKIVFSESIKNDTYSRLRYTLDFIDNHPLKPEGLKLIACRPSEIITNDDNLISYGSEYSHGFSVPTQNWIFFEKWIKSEMAVTNEYSYEDLLIYSVEKVKSNAISPLISGTIFSFDIFETIFFHISRIEEYHNAGQDGLIDENILFAVRNNLERIPVVDHLVYAFFSALGMLNKKEKTSVSLSHDADHLAKYVSYRQAFHFLGSVAKNHPENVLSYLSNWMKHKLLHKTDPYQDWDMILSDKNVEKTIYFIMESNHANDPQHISYANTAIAIERALAKNYKIGLHSSYNTWNDRNQYKKQKMILERMCGFEIVKSRQHYLHFAFPVTLDVLEEANITEDSSLGYNSHYGFRAGTGFSYRLYHLEKEEISSIIEKPLIWMDRAAWLNSGKNSNIFNSDVRSFISNNQSLTHFHINIHNSAYFDFAMYGIDLHEIFNQFYNEK